MQNINIINKLLSSLSSNLTNLEKARYLYLESCKIFTFSTKFQNTDEISFAKMYIQKVDASNLETTEVNCRTWSQLYSQLLNQVNIKNEIIDNGHQSVKFYIGEKEWLADATYGSYNDLSRVKNNDKTIGFGYSLYQGSNKCLISIEKEYINLIDEIDKKLGYSNQQMEKLIEFKKLLVNIKKGEYNINKLSIEPIVDTLTFKLEYLFSKLGKLNTGYYESKDFVMNLESQLLNANEFQHVKAVELKRTNKDGTVDILQCIYTIGNNPKYYLLAPNLPIIKITEEHLIHLAACGYGLEEGKKIIGVNYPKNFKIGEISKKNKLRLIRDNLFCNYSILIEYTKSQKRR